MKKKLTPAKIAKIRERRAQGASFESLSNTFGLSIGSIANALKSAPSSAKARRQERSSLSKSNSAPTAPEEREAERPAEAADAASPIPTREELLGYLAKQAAGLRKDVEDAADAQAKAAANRLLVGVQGLIAKLVPAPVDPEGTIPIAVGEMKQCGEQGEEKLLQLARALFKERDAWPKCRSCGQHIPPTDEAT